MRYFSTGVLTLAFCIVLIPASYAQNLPSQMRISDDGHMLLTGDQAPGGLYDSSIIRAIYLDFSQPNYWNQLVGNYQSKTDLPATMTVDGEIYDSVGVRFKGQTSYSQTQNSQKKSFNISTDYAISGQKLMGYKTLNLNNCFQDPSFLREVFYQKQIRRHIPAAKSNYVQLFINGENWGLYPNVQQLNKDYLKEWFFSGDGINWRADRPDGSIGGGPGGGGWGDGTAAINYLGADTAAYKPYYTLKSSGLDNPWDYLVAGCDALNNTPAAELPQVLPNFIDIDRTLWFLASEIAFSDDDSYVFKGKMDYYVYYEAETGRLTPLEYDGNSVMTGNLASWSAFYNANKVNYPLLNKILAVPIWRQRYLAHLRTILEEELNPAICNPMLDHYKAMIEPLVLADPKKLYSNTQFNNEVNALKTFINNRRNNLLGNAEVAQTAPVIQDANLYNLQGQSWEAPESGKQAYVTAQVSSGNGIFGVNLFFATGLVGNFTPLQMYDDGQHQDGASGDGLYGAVLPAQSAGTWVRFYIEAVAGNTARSVSYLPVGAEHDVFIYRVQSSLAPDVPVAINELMASNNTTVADEAGQYEDWIELFNKSDQGVDLSGFFLTDNAAIPDKWEIPQNTVIPANGYLVFWADEDGNDGDLHCNFKLSAGGELLQLRTPALELVDSMSFGPQVTDMGYARVPNGTGNFVIQAPTFNGNNDVTAVSGVTPGSTGFHLFPNPAGTVVYIRMEAAEQASRFVIRDLTGRAVLELEPTATLTEFSVSDWPKGVYTVQCGHLVKKLLVL
ncbi:MAG: CotH kinase family protein [Lewinellaceae bacterium]|nr:CotH kinase family protein [Saprospiraceae bacterium]MCB9355762.1 CotH kinase family protein [Lewinellaceae bacterium]